MSEDNAATSMLLATRNDVAGAIRPEITLWVLCSLLNNNGWDWDCVDMCVNI